MSLIKKALWAVPLLLVLLVLLVWSAGTASAGAPEPEPEAPIGGADEQAPAADRETTRSDKPESSRLFEELLVVGSVESARKIPGSAYFISKESVARQEYADIHRVLRQVPGVNIQEEEGYGLRPNIGIRGTGVNRSEKITLLEDGILIAPAPYSAPAAYYSPTAARMESFEVRKGSGSIRQGPYTNGGAINYVSRAIPGSLQARANVALGEEGLRRGAAWIGSSGQQFGWLLETSQLDTDGFKKLDGGGDTGVKLEDYVAKIRFNSRPDARMVQAVELKLGRTDQFGYETYLGLTETDFRSDPYRRYVGSAGDNIDTEHEQVQLSYYLQPSNRFSLTATIYRNDFFRNWFKLERVAGERVADVLADPENFAEELAILRGEIDSAPGALQVRNNRRDYDSEGLQTVLKFELGSGTRAHSLDLGVRFHRDLEDRFQEDDLFEITEGRRVFTEPGVPGSNANRIADAEALAMFVEDTFALGRWTVTPGVRVEVIDLMRRDFGTTDSTRTGESLSKRANDLTEVIPGIGVAYRLGPKSNVFFGAHRGFSPPSPSSTQEVDAEESINYEFGWRTRNGDASAELIAFFNDYDNLLGNDTAANGGEGTGDQFNGGEVTVQGLEAAVSGDLANSTGWSLPYRLAYTYTEAEFRDFFETSFSDWAPRVERGDELSYIPRHQLYAGLSVEKNKWAIHLDGNYTDQMRTKAGKGPIRSAELIESRVLFDLRAEIRLNERFKVWGQVLNVTDQVYVAARRPAGLRPGRPRAALFGLSFDFAR